MRYIDIGHSFIKYRDDQGTVQKLPTTLANLDQVLAVDSSICACVVDQAEFTDRINASNCFRYSTELTIDTTFGLLKNSYQDPSSMGVDRWLNMIAAYRAMDVIVISAGTALTIDCIAADGQHLDGVIVPGYQKYFEALSHIGPQLDLEKAKPDTRATLLRGWELLAKSMIEEFTRRHRLDDPIIYLTGGGAIQIQSQLDAYRSEVNENAVIDGLIQIAGLHK